ncbi:hypothetical protein HNP60_002723 [Sphingobium sp. B1D3A]|uniref:Uncharacterized protein n=1 Tax=Sphingobium lignivorans TaxID=2735886 RepID=A0ABR6NHI8_9SPHN|nr:hypothetical protein [Sphingobium lignivorans]
MNGSYRASQPNGQLSSYARFVVPHGKPGIERA